MLSYIIYLGIQTYYIYYYNAGTTYIHSTYLLLSEIPTRLWWTFHLKFLLIHNSFQLEFHSLQMKAKTRIFISCMLYLLPSTYSLIEKNRLTFSRQQSSWYFLFYLHYHVTYYFWVLHYWDNSSKIIKNSNRSTTKHIHHPLLLQ